VSLAFTRRIYLHSVWLDLASGARWRALLLRPAVVEDTAMTSRRPSPLFLLSTFLAT